MLSRWKMMAGVLGISIGGLAAAASQCPKWDKSKGRQPEKSSAKADTDVKLPPAGPPSSPLLPMPDVAPPSSPKAPQLVPTGPTPPPLALDAGTPTTPPLPTPNAVLPTPSALPPVPDFPTTPPVPDKPATKPMMEVKPVDAKPTSGALPPLPVIPASGTDPAAKPTEPKLPGEPLPPPAGPTKPIATTPAPAVAPPLPGKPMPSVTPAAPTGIELAPPPVGTPPLAKPPVAPVGMQPSSSTPPASPGLPGSPALSADPLVNVPPSKPTPAPAQALAGTTPFRIVLRVGEGEPTFEVKNGDNLVLKVACEKVDIKSPEKGPGMSEVIARGKVRFAGFGAEGTCDELKFFAGTGEVSMSGDVKVQVKDKLGRVESELTSGTLKYKIDASAVGGQIKP